MPNFIVELSRPAKQTASINVEAPDEATAAERARIIADHTSLLTWSTSIFPEGAARVESVNPPGYDG